MNADEIRKWHRTFKRPDELFEIRILGNRNPWSGYFYDVEQAIAALQPFDNMNIYYTINEVKKACASRSQFGQFQQVSGTATSKQDIEHRWWLPIDVDCERPSGVSSTDEEKELAHKKAAEVYYFLQANGFSAPVVCDSSSGYHILYPVDMANSDDAELAVKSFLETLAHRFTDDKVKIDTVLHDANRIIRLPGSFGRKGRSTEERPHRMAKILSAPNELHRMDYNFIKAFNERYKIVVEQPVRKYGGYNGGNATFNIRDFIRDHNISVAKEVSIPGGGTKFILTECPFDSSHKAPDAAIFEMPNGAIAFKCFHNSCQQHDWHELRQMLDPTAYEQKPYEQGNQQRVAVAQQQTQRQYTQQQPQRVVLPENSELGKKWLSLREIKKINIHDIERVKTGFTKLDYAIKGLFLCEVTIVSGSNSSGKSSWLNTLLANIVQQGYPFALWSGELRPDVLKTWIQMVIAGKRHLRQSQYGNFWYVPNEVAEQIDAWLEGRFFLYNNKYSNKWEQIFADMKELLGIGVRVFVLDNLMSMDIDIFEGDTNKKQKTLVQELCQFAKDNKVHIILVAHPRKSNAFLRKNDISGSANITDAVDNVFIIHRVNADFLRLGKEVYGTMINAYKDFGNVIEVCKNRMMGAQDFLVGMFYEQESRRFKNEANEAIEYGWSGASQGDLFAEQPSTATPAQESGLPFEAPSGEGAPF